MKSWVRNGLIGAGIGLVMIFLVYIFLNPVCAYYMDESCYFQSSLFLYYLSSILASINIPILFFIMISNVELGFLTFVWTPAVFYIVGSFTGSKRGRQILLGTLNISLLLSLISLPWSRVGNMDFIKFISIVPYSFIRFFLISFVISIVVFSLFSAIKKLTNKKREVVDDE